MEKYAYALSLISLIAIASISQSIAQGLLTDGDILAAQLLFAPRIATQIQFYMQADNTGSSETAYRIANSSITNTSPTLFGFLDMCDFLLTNTSNPNSTIIGRAQGLFGSSDLNTLALYNNFIVYFTSGDYNGSTLHVVGRDPVLPGIQELSISGGTQFFRLATGIVTFEQITVNNTAMIAVLQVNATVIHPIIT